MSDMAKVETIERFTEGLKCSISRAKELASATQNKMWLNVATQLQLLHANGMALAHKHSVTDSEREEQFSQYKKRLPN